MNPILMAALAKIEQAGMKAAEAALTLLAKDLAAGKPVLAALNDLAMTGAEEQAKLLDEALDAVGE